MNPVFRFSFPIGSAMSSDFLASMAANFPGHVGTIGNPEWNECTTKKMKNARIPWLERPSACNFRETEMHKKILAASASKQDFFDLLNEIFPRYLPARYHAMDCLSLSEGRTNGYFWDNAAHFLYCNAVVCPMFHDIMVQLPKTNDPAKMIFRDFQPARDWTFVKEKYIDECTTAEEFLLEPWVLLQLPFQPVLFYQWTVAVLAEALRLQRELVDFYTMDIPRRCGDAVAKLFSINQDLLDFSIRSLCYFSSISHHNGREKLYQGHPKVVEELDKILPAVKFVVGNKSREIIAALRRLTRSGPGNKEDWVAAPMDDLCFERFRVFFNRWFWETFRDRQILVKSGLRPEDGETPSCLVEESKNAAPDQDVDLEALKTVVLERILKPGRLKGEPNSKVLQEISTIGSRLNCFFELYSKYSGTSTEMGSSKTREGGVILDVINLHSDVKVAEALSLMTNGIHHHLSTTSCPNLYIDAVDCSGPELSYEAILEALKQVEPSKELRYENILIRTKTAHVRPTEKLDRSWRLDQIVRHFEARIKSLVISMLYQEHQSLGGSFRFHLEQQFVQYILPCFVACIPLLENRVCNLKRAQIMEFVGLVHEVLGAYEVEQYVPSQPWNPSKVPYVAFEGDFVEALVVRERSCKAVLKRKFGDHVESIMADLYHHLFKRDHKDELRQPEEESHRYVDVFMIQYNLMVCRIQFALQKLGWLRNDKANFVDTFFLGYASTHSVGDFGRDMYVLYSYFAELRSVNPNKERLKVTTEHLRGLGREMVLAAERLSLDQMLGLAVYYATRHTEEHCHKGHKDEFDKMPFDELSLVKACVNTQDWWKLKQILAPRFRAKDFGDKSQIDLQTAWSNACYAEALKALAKGKVAMRERGELSFFPVRHCRWCGVTALDDCRLCPECSADPLYPDIHFFCSQTCEEQCLKKKHIEEHARFEMVKLNISD